LSPKKVLPDFYEMNSESDFNGKATKVRQFVLYLKDVENVRLALLF